MAPTVPARPALSAAEPVRPTAPDAAEERTGWRVAVIDWGSAALSSPERGIQPPPLDGAAPMIAIAERFALEPAAVRALALLYAGWLLGHGDTGIPAAQVARAIGEEDDWRESLGRGELARHGMARSRRGKLRLRQVVGRFLDGDPPRAEAIRAPSRPAPAPPATTSILLVDGDEPLTAAAVRAAAMLGHDVAPIPLAQQRSPAKLARRLADGLFEARVQGALPLVAWDPALAESLERLPSPTLIAVRGEVPPALHRLPLLRTSPDAAP